MTHGRRLNIELQDPHNLLLMGTDERESLSENIRFLQKLGWKIWLDDWEEDINVFSLLPGVLFNGVKLDKSVIMCENFCDLVELAHRIAPVVVVEGIETNKDLLSAKKSGAELGQGYFWAHQHIAF